MMRIWNKENCIVGEGPLWDPRTDTLWFLDIRGKCLYQTHYPSGEQEKISLPQKVGCMALSETGRVLAAMEDGVYWVDTMTLAHQPMKLKGERFNDGKVGPDGAFYLGTVGADGSGAFYRLKDGCLTELFDGCCCSNGLDWTADGKTMVYTDSLLYKIELFDFDVHSGTLSNRRTLCTVPESWGKPDGLTLDSNDDIWVALWDGYRVLHIDRTTGQILGEIKTPCPKATCCSFGGADSKTLFITTAAMEDTAQYPEAGKTFAVSVDVGGRQGFYYRGDGQ